MKYWRNLKGLFSLVIITLCLNLYAQNNSETNTIHIVKKGETVYGISKQFNIPLETIYKLNPEAKKGVKKGDKLFIPVSTEEEGNPVVSNNEEVIPENTNKTATSVKVKEKKKKNKESVVTPIKEGKEDIKIETEISEEVVDFNEEVNDGKPLEIISIDEGNDITEDQDSVLNNEINAPLNIALLLDDPNSKKDIDFTRGILTSLDSFKNNDYKLNLKVFDGRVSTNDIISELDSFEPKIIITTADKTFPFFLADYGNSNDIFIANVFDLKNDLYEDNPSLIQMLPPSSVFNTKIAERIYKDNKYSKLLMVGEEDENDGIATELQNLFGDETEIMSLEDFGGFEPDLFQTILIYSYALRKEEVADFMNNMENLISNYPGLEYKLIGRPNWLAMMDDYEDRFKEYSVYIPSRVWIDEEEQPWKDFYKTFEELYGGIPIRSIPNFAASGFDIANYFIPLLSANMDESEVIFKNRLVPGLQNSIKLSKVEDGGYVNDVGYIIRFRPSGLYEKLIVE